jgi:hypothetical protein
MDAQYQYNELIITVPSAGSEVSFRYESEQEVVAVVGMKIMPLLDSAGSVFNNYQPISAGTLSLMNSQMQVFDDEYPAGNLLASLNVSPDDSFMTKFRDIKVVNSRDRIVLTGRYRDNAGVTGVNYPYAFKLCLRQLRAPESVKQ